jgi:hypothetical protein
MNKKEKRELEKYVKLMGRTFDDNKDMKPDIPICVLDMDEAIKPEDMEKATPLQEHEDNASHHDEQLPWNVREFKSITDTMFDTYKKKNADYGSSFDELYDEFGITSALIRLKDKYNRIKSLSQKQDIQVKSESVEDTLLDMANYAILTVMKMRHDKLDKMGYSNW